MLSLILCVLLFGYARRQGNTYVSLLILPSLFFLLLAYELRDSSLSQEYFDFARIQDFDYYLIFTVFQFLSVVLALTRIFCGAAPDLQPPLSLPPVNFKTASRLYYSASTLAIVAFLINLSHVGFSVSLLFLNPRLYEESFGSNSFINYLYFLNVPALCLSIYLRQHGYRLKFSALLNGILLLISLFHGIKFTVFDTLLLPAFFYFHCSRSPVRALRILVGALAVLLVFYLMFSLFVRGFTGDGGSLVTAVLNYILPNYYNLAYAIQQQPLQFDPISFIIPDKLPIPFLSLLTRGEYGFLLNDRFNMPTAYGIIYAALPPASWILFLPLLVRLRRRLVVRARQRQALHSIFVAAYLDFCIFFFWYFFAFNKTKYVYYIAVMFILGLCIHFRRHSNGRSQPTPSLPSSYEGLHPSQFKSIYLEFSNQPNRGHTFRGP